MTGISFPHPGETRTIRDIVDGQAQNPAERAVLITAAVKQLGKRIQDDFVHMAYFAYEMREGAMWTHLGLDSWNTWVNDLHIDCTPKQMSMLANMWEWLVERRGVSQEALARIGSSRAAYLLPTARRGPLDPDILQAAQEVPCDELLIRLGHKRGERDGESNLPCPHCGGIIYGARYVGKKKETT